MKWATKVKFHDNGRVSAVVFQCDDDTENESKSLTAYDEYIDVFETEKEAMSWKNEAYKA